MRQADGLAKLGGAEDSAEGLDLSLPTINVLWEVIEKTVLENHRKT